ncbi:ATP-binding cassette domain-containing protein [Microvirga tunisiensis]|uniref:ATP-binding cassette domain-containing protein n=1 Tax=Pannonibacter tanglangensis TaxID=2750084 RepID=A0A7X5JA50_9HYPH|nr:ABC transporter ATP-binding protein [Pannonibacter sp. XCT-53]NBN79020.1 ATP-binding cassette domain-containing protein [Pannonibacter sp. XCT-53]
MAPALLETHALTRILPATVPVTLVENITIRIGQGEFVAITGPSGSGKSSLLYLLGLLDRPTSGDVTVLGDSTRDLDSDSLARLRLKDLGFVFQFHFLLPEFTSLENVMIPMRKLGLLSRAAARERAYHLLASLGLADFAHRRPDQLSGGQRQRVAVARALANGPRLILADEPTGSLDSHATEQVFLALERIVKEDGTTVVAVTHDMQLAARMHRRLHLVDGRIDQDQMQPQPGA